MSDSPPLSAFDGRGDRVHLTCMAPGCRYGGRTFAAADLAEKYGAHVTLDDLRRRARCGEGHKGRIVVEVSSAPADRQRVDAWRSR